LLPLGTGRTLQPFAVAAVDVNAEHDSFVTRRTVPALLVHRSEAERFTGAHGIHQRTERKKIVPRGTKQRQAVTPQAQADVVRGGIGDFVAEVAVNAANINPLRAANIVIQTRIAQGGHVTRRAYSRAEGVLPEQVPARRPLGAAKQAQKARIGRRACMSAGHPFGVYRRMTIAA